MVEVVVAVVVVSGVVVAVSGVSGAEVPFVMSVTMSVTLSMTLVTESLI